MGTFVYSAPEMLIGNDSGVKADIYSFGVVLWEIVTGAIAKRGRLHEPKVGQQQHFLALSEIHLSLGL